MEDTQKLIKSLKSQDRQLSSNVKEDPFLRLWSKFQRNTKHAYDCPGIPPLMVSSDHTIGCQALYVSYITSEYKMISNIVLCTNIATVYSS